MNDPVKFFDHIERRFVSSDTGAYRLPADQQGEEGKLVTLTDQFSGRRQGLLIELIATHLRAHQLLLSPTPIAVYCITGNGNKLASLAVRRGSHKPPNAYHYEKRARQYSSEAEGNHRGSGVGIN